MVGNIKTKIEATIKEYGFYIFLSFSTLVVSLFQAFLPERYIYKGFIEKGTEIAQKIAQRLNDTHYIKEVLLNNHLISFFLLLFVTLVFLGFILFFLYLYMRLTGREILALPSFFPYPQWGIKDLIKIVVWIFFFIQVFSVGATLFKIFFHFSERFYALLSIFNSLIFDILILILLIFWLRIHYRQGLKALGIGTFWLRKGIGVGFISYFTFFPLLMGLIQISVKFIGMRQSPISSQPLICFLLSEKSPLILFITSFFIVIIGPIVEEILFRGLLYTSLKKLIGITQAMLITSLIFSLLHMNQMGFLPIFGLGMLFAYIYEKTGSLIPAITIHSLHNGVMLCFLFILRYIGLR